MDKLSSTAECSGCSPQKPGSQDGFRHLTFLGERAGALRRGRTTAWWWLPVCMLMVGLMGHLQLVVYPDEFVPLANGLFLLVCLWNRDLRLLWGMTAAFIAMLAIKMVRLPTEHALSSPSQWIFGGMQLANTLIVAGVIHAVIRLTGRLDTTIANLERTNAELEASNEELAAREEEITQQNEEMQSNQRQLLRTVTDTSTIALFLTDEHGCCTYLNSAAQRLTGYTLHELHSVPLHELLRVRGGEGRANLFLSESPQADGSRSSPYNDELVQKSGQTLPVLVSASPVMLDGRIVSTVVEMRDATEQHRHEQEREQLLDRERAARAEAERANRAKDEFVATLSHELRTPLNAVLGWAVLLKKNAGTNAAEMMKGIAVIERNARHQSQLIADLLDVSRIMAGKIRLDIQTIDVPLVIESSLESIRLAAEAKGIRLERVVEAVDGVVMGDPGRIQQVVWNLLSNAIKFTPPHGSVRLTVSRVASSVQITISDTGDGIEPTLLPHLFERYRQGDGSSTRRHGGLGLGLAIAKHLVELHGGTIRAHSDGPGLGATFTVVLPVRTVAPSEAVDGQPRHTHTPISLDGYAPTLAGMSILLVDDEDDARELLRRVLSDRGADVRTARSGEDALHMLDQSVPDLLLSDIGMPRMDGYTLIRSVRGHGEESVRSLPAIAMTAFARSEDRTRALLAGFQSHIAKPIEVAELSATIASLRLGVPRSRTPQMEAEPSDDGLMRGR